MREGWVAAIWVGVRMVGWEGSAALWPHTAALRLSLSAFGEGRYISGLCVVRDASAMLLLQLLA